MSNRSAAKDYFLKSLCFLLILLTLTVAAFFVAVKPIEPLIHRIEEHFPYQISDITLNDEKYAPLSLSSSEEISYVLGDKLANISSEDFGLNCSVYYGSNRVSYLEGCGLNAESSLFGDGGTSLIAGYEEGALSPLDYADNGDIITLTTNYGKFNYRVSEVSYSARSMEEYLDIGENKLVICSITSDFSAHSGENLYVIADFEGEVQ